MFRRIPIALLLTTPAIFSGCRLGNYVEAPKPAETPVKYYRAEPVTVTYCAVATSSGCADVAVNQMPATLNKVISDPVAFIKDQTHAELGYLTHRNGSGYVLPIGIEENGTLGLAQNFSAETFWVDPQCLSQLYLEEEGQIQSQDAGSQFNGITVDGRVSLRVFLMNSLSGSCEVTLQELADCYADSTDCGGVSDAENQQIQTAVKDFFNPYITAGVLTEADIPNVSALAFEAIYR